MPTYYPLTEALAWFTQMSRLFTLIRGIVLNLEPGVVSLDPSNESMPVKIRDLESFEEFFWILEQNFSLFPVVVAEVKGTTTESNWQAGLKALQDKYPLLSAMVCKEPGKRPYFTKTNDIPVPLLIEPWSDGLVIHKLMEDELLNSFGDGSGPLARIRLYHGESKSVVLLSAHHCAFDGKSILFMIQDLIAAVAGEELVSETQVYSFQALFDQVAAPVPYRKQLDGEVVAPPDGLLAGLPPIKVDRLLLSEEETAAFVKRAKEEKTTVHAGLMVAFARALRSDLEKHPVRILTPIDARRYLETTEVAGMLITMCQTEVDAFSELSFWAKARSAGEELLPYLSEEGTLSTRKLTEDMVEEEHTARGLLQVFAESDTVHDLILTNYARYKARTKYRDLQITSLFTGSAGPAHKISVITLDGRLGMTLVSRDMPSHLLEDARKILVSQLA